MGRRGRAQRVELRQWEYLDGQTVTAPTNFELTLPEAATALSLEPEGGACYYAINQTGAAASSHGYVADGGLRVLGPYVNLITVHIHGPQTSRVHIQYFREA